MYRCLVRYIAGFSENVRVIFERFEFGREIERMCEADILCMMVSKFYDVDLHPDNVDEAVAGGSHGTTCL